MKTVIRHPISNAWSKVRVGVALQLINGRAFKPSEWEEKGLPIVRIQNLNNPEAPFNYYEGDLPEKFLLNSGDLLFAWSGTPGTSFGAHIWRGGKAWLNQHIFKVLFDETEFDKRFLRLAINQNLTEYIQAAHGAAGLAHITKGKFEQSELLKPPLDEQRSIVAEIEKQFSRLDEAVASLKRTQANLKRYKAAVLKAAVEGKLTEDWRKQHPNIEPASKLLERILTERRAKWSGKGKYKEPIALDTTDLPSLPKGWTWVAFEQLSLRVTVGHVGPMKHEYVPKGIPFLRSQNVRENRFDPEGLLFIRPEFHKRLSKSVVQAGDLAVVRSGSVGVTCVIPEVLGEANCADLVLIQRPIGLVPQFGAYYMNSLAKRRIEAGKVGVALTHFNTKSVAAMPVPLPSLAEQEQIVAEVERRLSVIDELEATVEANLTRADRLRQSILSSAFSGKLVVLAKTPPHLCLSAVVS